jgi:hypothetical protein
MRYEVYVKKAGSSKWKLIGESDSKNDAIEMGARSEINGHFSVYDSQCDEWLSLGL